MQQGGTALVVAAKGGEPQRRGQFDVGASLAEDTHAVRAPLLHRGLERREPRGRLEVDGGARDDEEADARRVALVRGQVERRAAVR